MFEEFITTVPLSKQDKVRKKLYYNFISENTSFFTVSDFPYFALIHLLCYSFTKWTFASFLTWPACHIFLSMTKIPLKLNAITLLASARIVLYALYILIDICCCILCSLRVRLLLFIILCQIDVELTTIGGSHLFEALDTPILNNIFASPDVLLFLIFILLYHLFHKKIWVLRMTF